MRNDEDEDFSNESFFVIEDDDWNLFLSLYSP
jgi:hypothetical protein